MNFFVAIPSYQRAETLRDKTLSLLQRYGIDPGVITVFVADKEEAARYRDVLRLGTYSRIVVGQLGITAQRNFMLDYFPDGASVLSIDDDITGVSFSAGPTQLEPCSDLKNLANEAFAVCRRTGARLWGLYPVANPYFMKQSVSTDLKFIIGCFHGYINQGGASPLRVTLHDKDDVERTCNCYLADGTVVRFNNFVSHQKYLKEKGGLQSVRTDDSIRAAAARLIELFPDLCTLNTAKKGGVADVKLRDRRKRK